MARAQVSVRLSKNITDVNEIARRCQIADDLAFWRAEIPGKVLATGEALTGPTTRPGQRVQVHNPPPGAEVGPGAIATQGRATADSADAFGFKWQWAGRSSKHMRFDWSGPDRI